MLSQIVEILISGLATSGIYALMAVGVTLIFGVGRVINFAHGAFYTLGAYFCYLFAEEAGLGPWLGLAAAVVTVAVMAALFDRYFIDPLRKYEIIIWMMTFALAFAVREAIVLTFGGRPYAIPPFIPGSVEILGVRVAAQRLLVPLVSGVALLGLWLLLYRTQLGRGVRAVAQNRDAAALMGIPVRLTFSLVMALSAGLAALAGIIIAPTAIITPDMGLEALLMAFTIVILGGIGSLRGSLLAALIVGYAATLVSFLLSPQFVTFASLAVVFAVILTRPTGLFGLAVEERG